VFSSARAAVARALPDFAAILAFLAFSRARVSGEVVGDGGGSL
jgi:hypothetical protein